MSPSCQRNAWLEQSQSIKEPFTHKAEKMLPHASLPLASSNKADMPDADISLSQTYEDFTFAFDVKAIYLIQVLFTAAPVFAFAAV